MKGNNTQFASLMNGFILLAIGLAVLQEAIIFLNKPGPSN